MINLVAIYTLWLREMKRFFRLKSRLFGFIGMPFFFLAFIAMVPIDVSGKPIDINFMAPGIIGMILLFSSIFAGLSVLWDREFGFLREIMVTPVSRSSIILGRTAGGVTTGLIQGMIILTLSIPLGLKIESITGLLLSILFIVLIAATFIGLGLALASRMEDMSGYSLISNFLIMPILLFSGAILPLDSFPSWIRYFAYIDPLTYGVDGLRFCLTGVGEFSLILNLLLLSISCAAMVGLGTYLFDKTEVD
jgi:ABC-2 type transport system permease protein